MPNVGQIVYNLKDYRNEYNYISTSGSDITQIVYSKSNKYNASTVTDTGASNVQKVNLYNMSGYKKLVDKTDGLVTQITKLGIQAPPGTKFTINNDKNLIMGRTGVYELDEDFKVNELHFERPKKFQLDENQTNTALENGIAALQQARENFDQAVSEITAEEGTADYWKEYNTCYVNYMREYQGAYAQFLQGVNGIYRLPNPDVPDSDENFEELENIIIDFLY